MIKKSGPVFHCMYCGEEIVSMEIVTSDIDRRWCPTCGHMSFTTMICGALVAASKGNGEMSIFYLLKKLEKYREATELLNRDLQERGDQPISAATAMTILVDAGVTYLDMMRQSEKEPLILDPKDADL